MQVCDQNIQISERIMEAVKTILAGLKLFISTVIIHITDFRDTGGAANDGQGKILRGKWLILQSIRIRMKHFCRFCVFYGVNKK